MVHLKWEEGSIHVLEVSSCYGWMPLRLKCSTLILFKTKEGVWSLYNRIVLLIGCTVLFKETRVIFLLLRSHTYLQITSIERSAARLANGIQADASQSQKAPFQWHSWARGWIFAGVRFGRKMLLWRPGAFSRGVAGRGIHLRTTGLTQLDCIQRGASLWLPTGSQRRW